MLVNGLIRQKDGVHKAQWKAEKQRRISEQDTVNQSGLVAVGHLTPWPELS